MGQRAAKRYAQAILDLAKDQKSMETLLEQTQAIENAINDSDDLRSVLNSPIIQSEVKLSIAQEIFKSFDPMLIKLFETLAENERFDHLKWICQAYASMYNKFHNIQEAHIISAIELDAKTLKALQDQIKKLTGDEAKILTEVNEALIGGFVLKLNDLQYDASISGHLNKIKRNFYN
jgi:F-type H+-transporting ATPase subunit delta